MLKIPSSVVTKSDFINLQREVDKVADQLVQSKIRDVVAKSHENVGISATLEQLLKENEISATAHSMKELSAQLDEVRKSSTLVRIVFAVEPRSDVLRKIAKWFRDSSGKQVFIAVGIQPQIAAGCVVQTQNRSFDLSLRKRLLNSQTTLKEVIERV